MRSNLATLIPQEIGGIFNIYLFEEETSIEDAKLIPDESDVASDYKISFSVKGDSVKV